MLLCAGPGRRKRRLLAPAPRQLVEPASDTDGEASLTGGGCSALSFAEAGGLPLMLRSPRLGAGGGGEDLRAGDLGFMACSDAPATPGGPDAAGALLDGGLLGPGGAPVPADAVAGDAELDNAITWLGVPSPAAKLHDGVRCIQALFWQHDLHRSRVNCTYASW